MVTTQLLKRKFLVLPPQEKLIKLKAMLEILKSTLPLYQDIYLHVQHMGEHISQSLLNLYYTMICGNIELLQGDSLEKFKKDLSSFKYSLKSDIGVKTDQQDLQHMEKILEELGV